MPTEAPLWSFEKLSTAFPSDGRVWTLARFADRAHEKFGKEIVTWPDAPPPNLSAVIALGGGTLIDRAKVWRHHESAATKLFAVPSMWGSGAENSPVAVINGAGEKEIFLGAEYLPDARLIWAELAQGASELRRRNACGDTWSHALEGFLSPIASDALREQLASVIRGLLRLGAADDQGWFELSARACAGQAQSSVGLVHGIAHVLEPRLGTGRTALGHAALCRTFAWPVFRYDLGSPKVVGLLKNFGLEVSAIDDVLRGFFDREIYRELQPDLAEHWKKVLRDPCTRTNSVVVRPASLSYFTEEKFDE